MLTWKNMMLEMLITGMFMFLRLCRQGIRVTGVLHVLDLEVLIISIKGMHDKVVVVAYIFLSFYSPVVMFCSLTYNPVNVKDKQ
jgi:uncharacterized membrane protein